MEEPAEDLVVWRPAAAGALPLVVRFRGLEPTRWLRRLPECGCNACDHGSASYLERLDDDVAG